MFMAVGAYTYRLKVQSLTLLFPFELQVSDELQFKVTKQLKKKSELL